MREAVIKKWLSPKKYRPWGKGSQRGGDTISPHGLRELHRAPIVLFRFGKLFLNIDNEQGTTRTIWPDGKTYDTYADESAEMRWIATQYGYPDNWEGCKRFGIHGIALLHMIALTNELDCSPTLRYHAVNGMVNLPKTYPTLKQREEEKKFANTMQRFLNRKDCSRYWAVRYLKKEPVMLGFCDLLDIRCFQLPEHFHEMLVTAREAAEAWEKENSEL